MIVAPRDLEQTWNVPSDVAEPDDEGFEHEWPRALGDEGRADDLIWSFSSGIRSCRE